MSGIISLYNKHFPIIEGGGYCYKLCPAKHICAVNVLKRSCLTSFSIKIKTAFPGMVVMFMALMLLAMTGCLHPASAEDKAGQNISVTNNLENVEISNGDTKLIVDAENNTIRIVIDGKIMAVFDQRGLHVDGPVTANTGPLESSNQIKDGR